MERWVGRVAVVTGTSAGIGAAIAYQLQDAGLIVVALARRVEKIQGAIDAARKGAKERGRTQIGKATSPGKLYTQKCDVTKEEDILNAFKWIKNNVGRVDILVNNAGVAGDVSVTETGTSDWKRILDTNVLGLSICTREAIQIMREKGVDDGHIVHIGSFLGHTAPLSGNAMYPASKHAVRVLTEGLRKELVAAKSKIRVTEICPGLVKTDIINDSEKTKPEVVFKNYVYLESEDIADTVLYSLSVPAHVQIHHLMVKPVGELF